MLDLRTVNNIIMWKNHDYDTCFLTVSIETLLLSVQGADITVMQISVNDIM